MFLSMIGLITVRLSNNADLGHTAELRSLVWLFAGIAAGMIFALVQRHPQRILGSVAPGWFILDLALLTHGIWQKQPAPIILAGFAAGWPLVSLQTALLNAIPWRDRFRALMLLLGPLLVIMMASVIWPSDQVRTWNRFWLLIPAILGTIVFGRLFIRETLEIIVEIAFLPMYRIKAFGPGAQAAPLRGPALIVANHAAWFDPLWIAKVMPCRITTLMISRFFDLPFIRWVVGPVAHAIRVPDRRFRRDAPEIAEAIRRLERGEVVLIFPEGWLRRSETRVLRRFGQGVYHILREQPYTPVVACWIEGGWGSYTSHFHGPPTKNKKLDRRRPIQIGIAKPEILSLDLLLDSRKTREYLMQACLGARAHLGLPVPEITPFANGEAEEPS
jgi:1-acyl-sn-glycerol-3-phosphate acyltransferase